jgi:hypothetical protein
MKYLRVVLSGLSIFALPACASAHAFGQQFNLPLPVDFYVTGGVCAFIASCVVLLLFSEPSAQSTAHRALPGGVRFPSILKWILAGTGFFLLVTSLTLAYFGTQDFATNPLPNLFWIIFLLLFTYLTGLLVGGLWQYLDPFRLIAGVIADDIPERPAPAWLPYLPSVLLIVLLWLELYSNALGSIPLVIGTTLVFIASLDNIGSSIWGVNTWFQNGSLFSSLFGLVSKVAPIQILDGRVRLMWPGERLVREEAPHLGVLFFTLVLLGSTVLDGLRETAIWYQILQPVPFNWDNFIGVALLIVIPFVLFAFYSFCLYCMKRLTDTQLSIPQLRLRFAHSLVPIAVAYHFAHYFSLILSQGQYFVAQVSDPFSKGWDIFGTAAYQMNLNLVGGDKVWYTQLSAIVLGHVLAAVVAHYIAQRTFGSKYQIIVSQLPMLVFMVGLTTFGLWTLAQPFVQ